MLALKILAVILSGALLLNQVETSDSVNIGKSLEEIRISALLDKKEVPQNRFLKLTVRLEWQGNQSRYEISDFENPVVTNLEIIGSSSANKVEAIGGKNFSIREYEFTLKPVEMGMAYVEGIILKYKDTTTGEENRLTTQRLGVKVVEAVAEKRGRRFGPIGYILIGIFVLTAGAMGFVYRKKFIAKRQEEAKEPEVILEELYLTDLKNTVDLSSTKVKDSFSTLSRLYRKYLSQKFNIATMETTTDEILHNLKKINSEERVISDSDEILKACDLAKFAGSEASKAELERIYTKVEAILEKYLAEAKERAAQEKEKSKN